MSFFRLSFLSHQLSFLRLRATPISFDLSWAPSSNATKQFYDNFINLILRSIIPRITIAGKRGFVNNSSILSRYISSNGQSLKNRESFEMIQLYMQILSRSLQSHDVYQFRALPPLW